MNSSDSPFLILPALRPEFFFLRVPHCGLHKSWGDISNSPSCLAHPPTHCTPIKGSLYEWDMIPLMCLHHHLNCLKGGAHCSIPWSHSELYSNDWVKQWCLTNPWFASWRIYKSISLWEEQWLLCSKRGFILELLLSACHPILAASDFRACWKLSPPSY